MTDRDPASFTAEELSNPATVPATLAQAAAVRPDLWPAILANPGCYPALGDWIRQQQPGIVAAAPGFGQPGGAQPQPGFGQPGGAQPQPGFGQPGGGEPGFGAGQGDFGRVSPASPQQFAPSPAPATGPNGKQGAPGPQIMLALAALLAIIALPLPLITGQVFGMSVSVNYFSDGAGAEGKILLGLFIVTLLFAVIAVTRQTWARVLAGIVGLIAGGFGAYDAFHTWSNIADASGLASPGFGLILLALASVLLIVLSIVNFVYSKADKQPAGAPAPNAGTPWQ